MRQIALPTGLVDNKVCAIDDVWSGVRMVIRPELRRGDAAECGMVEERRCGIGTCSVPRPSLGDYVAGTGPRGAADAAGEC